MRAEDRAPWDQWWLAIGQRGLRTTLATWDFGPAYDEPVRHALQDGATAVDLRRLLAATREQLGDPPDEDADDECGFRIASWWETTRYGRKNFSVN